MAGVKVAIVDINETAGKNLVSRVVNSGGEAIFIKTDVTKSDDVENMVAQTVKQFGALDFAFNNAGIEGKLGVPAANITEDDWGRILSINLTAVWLCMKYELQHMVENGGGVIVNTSSTAGLASAVNSGAAYCASKHGVIGLTKTAAKEYRAQNIRINAICPGGVNTPLLQRTAGDADISSIMKTNPGLISSPEDVVESVVWLFSQSSSIVNGHALLLDNGMLA
ncbi:SDR family oxidoreductase [Colwellia sp. 20A7]|uniref:SDR family oxidoreductase n=1 Tax=Colwellia sp. 20A7 TaxID=2689569 RepID=UPI00135AD78C|nr:SDR family oxidoreductase [Colwellia sp. 20A7]